MLSKLQYILQHNCLLGINKPVVIGVSGGPDSLCLLDMLWRMKFNIIVAHLNHGLRPSASAEARKVHNEATSRKLPFISREIRVAEYADSRKLSLEEAARVLRYQFLFEQARIFSAQAVAVGHSADDQAETVLMHILRGSGSAGLGGMDYRWLPNAWDDKIPLVRPLLGFWRREIIHYLMENGLEPTDDESNKDVNYLRNRIRAELIPKLEEYNPQLRSGLLKMAEILRGDRAIIDQAVNIIWKKCLIDQGSGYIAYSLKRMRSQSLGMQRQLMRRGIAFLRPGLRNIDFDTVERGISALSNKDYQRTELVAGIYIATEGDRLFLVCQDTDLQAEDWPQIPVDQRLRVEIPGTYNLGGWVFEADYVDEVDAFVTSTGNDQNSYQAWVDADKLAQPILLRGRLPGDRIKPVGMDGHSIKISDLMINQKFPARARKCWPLLTSGEQIVWVPGSHVGHEFRITSDTTHVVHMTLMRKMG